MSLKFRVSFQRYFFKTSLEFVEFRRLNHVCRFQLLSFLWLLLIPLIKTHINITRWQLQRIFYHRQPHPKFHNELHFTTDRIDLKNIVNEKDSRTSAMLVLNIWCAFTWPNERILSQYGITDRLSDFLGFLSVSTLANKLSAR